DRVVINGQLALPRLDIVENCHSLRADNRQTPLAIRIEPRREQVPAQISGKTHMQMREIAEMVERCCPFSMDLYRRSAGDGQDHGKIVRGKVPQRIIFGMEFSEAQTMRMDIADFSQFAGIDQRLELLEGRVKAQHMTDHINAALVPRR